MLPPDHSEPARGVVPRLYNTATQRQLERLWLKGGVFLAFH
jgi:DMSO/TMAO reductase YedYZ molybdopterin-dependent catalytic subunit